MAHLGLELKIQAKVLPAARKPLMNQNSDVKVIQIQLHIMLMYKIKHLTYDITA